MGVSKKVQLTVGKDNRITEQAGKETQDINVMAKKAFRNRLLGNPDGRQPIFGDVSSASYHEQMNTVLDIQNRFNKLPARTRRQFQNNPFICLKFVEDPSNAKQAVKMGLLIDEEGIFDEGPVEPVPNAVQTSLVDPPPPEGSSPGQALDAFLDRTADPEANPSFKKGGKK